MPIPFSDYRERSTLMALIKNRLPETGLHAPSRSIAPLFRYFRRDSSRLFYLLGSSPRVEGEEGKVEEESRIEDVAGSYS